MKIKVKRFDKSLPLPEYENDAAGFDFFCRKSVNIPTREIEFVSVNAAVRIPRGYVLLIFLRSSMTFKKGVMLANGVGVIDSFFHGDKDEIIIQLFNISDKTVSIKKGEKIAQGILIKHEKAEWEEVESLGSKGRGYKVEKEV